MKRTKRTWKKGKVYLREEKEREKEVMKRGGRREIRVCRGERKTLRYTIGGIAGSEAGGLRCALGNASSSIS